MDVLIKNMKMPKSCYSDEFKYCPFLFFDYDTKSHCGLSDDIRCTKTKRPKDCPLVKLPPHGDLIDKASVLSLLRYYCDMREYKKDVRCEDCENRNACVVRPIMDEVNKLGTVLEAST